MSDSKLIQNLTPDLQQCIYYLDVMAQGVKKLMTWCKQQRLGIRDQDKKEQLSQLGFQVYQCSWHLNDKQREQIIEICTRLETVLLHANKIIFFNEKC